jgi:hypothetical protein
MPTTQWLHQATTLDDGPVLMKGGMNMSNSPLLAADLLVRSPGVVSEIFADGFDASGSIHEVRASDILVPDTLFVVIRIFPLQ